jgi:hypothetical protein
LRQKPSVGGKNTVEHPSQREPSSVGSELSVNQPSIAGVLVMPPD